MKFRSTGKASPPVSFREALLRGLAPDGGLYMPETIPVCPPSLLRTFPQMSFAEESLELSRLWLEEEVPALALESMIRDAMNFEVPVVQLEGGISVLELFHGPTLAFKDFGARFMARLMAHFNENDQPLTILVATSGDTGSAVAHGFHNVEGIRVIVLYPEGRVSLTQERQMATLGGNIHAVRVAGSFDDCQRLVKQAFRDPELAARLRLTSANSINIARLIPQSFYYFHAAGRAAGRGRAVAFSVPSGNFGNLTAGLLAKRMGLPVAGFVASTNRNDVVPEYLKTGAFRARPSVETISNAMDVGDPSNFARMLDLYDSSLDAIRSEVAGASFSDDATRVAIREVHRRTGYVLDPHGAVAYLGAVEFLKRHPDCEVIALETAHPAKFLDVVEPVLGSRVPIPDRLKACLDRPVLSTQLSASFETFRQFLLTLQ